MMRDASLERTPYGSLLDSPAFGALRDRGTTRRPTIPRQGSGRRVSVRLAVTRPVIAEGHPPGTAGFPDHAPRAPVPADRVRRLRNNATKSEPAMGRITSSNPRM